MSSGDWSAPRNTVYETNGAQLASSIGTSITTGTFNTKGAYVQLTASLARDCEHFWVMCHPPNLPVLFDVAIGAAASEVVIIGNILAKRRSVMSWWYYFPISVAAGSRVAIRAQSTGSAAAPRFELICGAQGFGGEIPYQVIETLGAGTADTSGVTVDPGGVAHTKGAYSQLVASTARDYRALQVTIMQENLTTNNVRSLVDIAVGAAASEQIIISNLYFCQETLYDYGFGLYTFPVDIQAGTRIAVRSQSDDTNATDRTLDVILHGIS
jgi:hypothetical protein